MLHPYKKKQKKKPHTNIKKKKKKTKTKTKDKKTPSANRRGGRKAPSHLWVVEKVRKKLREWGSIETLWERKSQPCAWQGNW